jgi:hypothetical protein
MCLLFRGLTSESAAPVIYTVSLWDNSGICKLNFPLINTSKFRFRLEARWSFWGSAVYLSAIGSLGILSPDPFLSAVLCFNHAISITRGAGIAQWYSTGLWAGWSGVWIPAGAGNFALHHRVQTGSGAHPASYPMGTRGSFPGGKAAGAWRWPFTSA